MRNYPCHKARCAVGLGGLGARLHRLDEDQGGAVLMICLAAALILMLMSWVLFDGVAVTKDKIEIQGSADMAAHSQASVKARSMNMLAFSNVGKRSVVGVYAVYDSMMFSYLFWLEEQIAKCDDTTSPECDEDLVTENHELFEEEFENDYEVFQDNYPYYMADLQALDNYQNYVVAMTPWWGWSEAVTRAQRNGATLATSIPSPRGAFPPGFPNINANVIRAARGGGGIGIGGGSGMPLSNVERLPVRRGEFLGDNLMGGMVGDGMRDNPAWISSEHQHNVDRHRSRSSLGAASDAVVGPGGSFGIPPHGLMVQMLECYTLADCAEDDERLLAHYGAPWRLDDYEDEADWLFDTSNVVLTYQAGDHFGAWRQKFETIGDDYDRGDDEQAITYEPGGYWGMARSEISFQGGGAPNMWNPSWTSRLRPMALPDEFRDQHLSFNALYQSSIHHLLLSGRMHTNVIGVGAVEVFDDLVYLERVSRALGQTTVEGIGR